MDVIELTINNWDKYNPKKDQKNYTWLRLDNRIATDQKIFTLSHEKKWIWICILCEASKTNTGYVSFTIHWLAYISKSSEKIVSQTIDFLIQTKLVGPSGRVPPPYTLSTDVRTDVRTNEKHMSSGDDECVNLDLKSEQQKRLQENKSSQLMRIWNEHRGSLPECKALSQKRFKHSLARWREKPDELYWVSVVQKIAKSKFCNGGSESGWRATFDFFIQPDTHIKTTEGKYDDFKKSMNINKFEELELEKFKRDAKQREINARDKNTGRSFSDVSRAFEKVDEDLP